MGAAATGCQCSSRCGPQTEPSATGEDLPRQDIESEPVKPKRLQGLKVALSSSSAAGDNVSTAAKVRGLAEESVEAAWKKLESEFSVQKMVWESVQLGRGFRHQGAVATLQSKIEYAVLTHKTEPINAVAALEEVLERHGQEMSNGIDAATGGLLNHALARMIKETVETERLRPARLGLAECLVAKDTDGVSGNTDALVDGCQLGNAKLEKQIRKVLFNKPSGS
mmetsp:Transcript_38175/g.98664  ORF Transcript_38175/g.98664 Transcript_38175/m.98664 type:complete len:224 (-) Transcript_38175:80-751(-)